MTDELNDINVQPTDPGFTMDTANALSDTETETEEQDKIKASAEQAAKDIYSGKNHFDISNYVVDSNKTNGKTIGGIYKVEDGGYTRKDDLRGRAGLSKEDSWTDFVNKGGHIPTGYEIESRLLMAEEKRQKLYSRYSSGAIGKSTFLMEAYGYDIMKRDGIDLESVSYWYKRKSDGFYDSPLDNDSFLQEKLNEAEQQFIADDKIKKSFEESYSFSNGSEMTLDSFNKHFGSRYENEYIAQLGGTAAMMTKYESGFLSIDPFIDANGDGEISDGDYFYHDDGRVYQIGTGCKVLTYDDKGKPLEVQVGDGKGDVVRTFGVGLLEGILGIGESIASLGAMIVDIFLPGKLTATTSLIEKTDKWKNSLKIGDTAVFNDNIWTADGFQSSKNTQIQVADAIGNIAGMVLLTAATFGAGALISGAKATMTAGSAAAASAIKAGTKLGVKAGVKAAKEVAEATALAVGKNATKASVGAALKYGALSLASTATTGLSSVTGFANGVFKSSTKATGDIVVKTTRDAMLAMTKSTLRSATSAAILTSRDFVDNVARSAAVNDSLPESERRSTSQIFTDSLGVAAINFGISTVLRATWDDIGITGRMGDMLGQTIHKKTTGAGIELMQNNLFKLCNSTARMRTIIDTLSDGAEMVLTNVNNQYAMSGGFSQLGSKEWSDGAKAFLTSPAGLTSLMFSEAATYRGSIGKTSYGSEHQAYDATAEKVSVLNEKIYNAMTKTVIERAGELGESNPEIVASNEYVQKFASWTADGAKLLEDNFGMMFTKNGSIEFTKDGTITFEKGSSKEARKGDLVYKAKVEKEGDLDVNSLPQSFKTLAAIMRLKNDGTADKIIGDAVNDILVDVNLDLQMKRSYQVATAITAIKESRLEMNQMALDSKKLKTFSSRLKDNAIVNKMKGIFEGYNGSKWKSVLAKNDMEEAQAEWQQILDNPDILLRAKFAMDESFGKFEELADKNSAEFFEAKSVDSLTELINGANSGSQDAQDCKDIIEAIRKAKAEYGYDNTAIENIVFYRLKPQSLLGKEWNSDGGKIQKEYMKELSKIKFLSSILGDNINDKSLGDFDFHVMPVTGADSKVTYYMFITPNEAPLKAVKNIYSAQEAKTAVEELAYGNYSEKRHAIDMLISIIGGFKTDAKTHDDVVRVINEAKAKGTTVNDYYGELGKYIELAYANGLLSANEAAILAVRNFKDGNALQPGVAPNITKIYDIYNQFKAVDKAFEAFSAYAQRTDRDEQMTKKKRDDYTKSAGELKAMMDANPEIKNAVLKDGSGFISESVYKTRIEQEEAVPFLISRITNSDSAKGNRSTNNKKITEFEKTYKSINNFYKEIGYMKEFIKDDSGKNSLEKLIPDKKYDNDYFLSIINDKPDNIIHSFQKSGYGKNSIDKSIYESIIGITNSTVLDGKELDVALHFINLANMLQDVQKNNTSKTALSKSITYIYEANADIQSSSNIDKNIKNISSKICAEIKRVSVLSAKQEYMEKIKTTFPSAYKYITRDDNLEFKNLLQDTGTTPEEFMSIVSGDDRFFTENLELIKNTYKAKNIFNGTETIKKSSKCIINLVDFRTFEENKLFNIEMNKALSGAKDSEDAIKAIKSAVGGVFAVFAHSKNLSKFISLISNNPVLEFDLRIPSERAVAKKFFSDMGYKNFNDELIQSVPGVNYRPNSDAGVSIKSEYDTSAVSVPVNIKNIVGNKKIQLDVRQAILNKKINEVFFSDDSFATIQELLFFLQDIPTTDDARLSNSKYSIYTDNELKAGKAASQVSSIKEILIDAVGVSGRTDTDQYKTLKTLLSLRQALLLTEDFFGTKYEQAKEAIYIADEARRKKLQNIGFVFCNGNEIISFKLTPDNEIEAYKEIMQSANIANVLPFSDDMLSYFKSLSTLNPNKGYTIPGFGQNLPVDQKSTGANYNNVLAEQMKSTSMTNDAESLDAFLTLCKLCPDEVTNPGSTDNIKSECVPVVLNFDKHENDFNDGNTKTIKQLKDLVEAANEIDENNFYLMQLRSQLNALDKLNEEHDEFVFLADEQISKVILDNVDKEAVEIKDLIDNLVYEQPIETKHNQTKITDTSKPEFNEIGKQKENIGITSKVTETLGIKATENEFNNLKEKATVESIAKLLNETYVLAKSKESIFKIDDEDMKPSARVNAILRRTKNISDDGTISYEISIQDIASFERKKDIELLCKTIGASDEQKKMLLDKYEKVNELIGINESMTTNLTIGTRQALPDASSPSVGEAVLVRGGNIDGAKEIEQNKLKLSFIKHTRNFYKQKMISIASKYSDESGIQNALNRYVSEHGLITNEGSRTIYDMNNSYQAAMLMCGYTRMCDELRGSGLFKNTNGEIDEDTISKNAMKILSPTIGVSTSDEYEGIHIITDKGEMVSSIRTNATRADDASDFLLEFYKLYANGKTPKYIVVIDKDAGVESCEPKMVEVTERLQKDIIDAFYTKTALEKDINQTSAEFWANQIPHVKILNDMAISAARKLGLPKEMDRLFLQTCVQISKDYTVDAANLSTESMLTSVIKAANKMVDNLQDGTTKIDRENIDIEVNNFVKNVNDGLMFGVSNNYIPDDIKYALDFYAEEQSNQYAKKAVEAYLSGNEYALPVSEENKIQEWEIIKAYLMLSKSGACRAQYIKAISENNVNNRQMYGAAGDKPEAFVKWEKIKDDFIAFDCEWIYDNTGKEYLTEISLRHFKKSVDKNGEIGIALADNGSKLINFDTKTLTSGLGEQQVNAKFSRYISDMTSKLRKEEMSDTDIKKYLSDMLHHDGIKANDADTELAAFIKNSKATGFISHNGKGSGSDIDVMKKNISTTAGLIDASDNHLDVYNDMLMTIIPKHNKFLNPYKLTLNDLYKQLFENIEPDYSPDTKANKHTAQYDVDRLAKATYELFKETPDSIKSQQDFLLDELEKLHNKIYERDNNKADRNKIAEELNKAIASIEKNRESIGSAIINSDFVKAVSEYQKLTNERLKPALDVINSFRRELDYKVWIRQQNEDVSMALGRTKEILDKIYPNYNKGQKFLAYLVSCDGRYTNLEAKLSVLHQAMTELYSDILNDDGTKRSLSNFKTFDVFSRILSEDKLDVLMDKINDIQAGDKNKRFAELSLAQMQGQRFDMAEAMGFIDTKGGESRKFIDDNSYTKAALVTYFGKIKNAVDIIPQDKDSCFGDDFDTKFANNLLANLSNLIVQPEEKIKFENLNTLFDDSSSSEILKEIIQSKDKFSRAWRKVVSIPPGKKIKDVEGVEKTMSADCIVISDKTFKELFGNPYADVVDNYEDREIIVPVIRQPSVKADSITSYKLIVVAGNDNTINISTTSLFTNHEGDFDGDAINIFKPSIQESKLLKGIYTNIHTSARIIDEVLVNAKEFAFGNKHGERYEKVMSFATTHDEIKKSMDKSIGDVLKSKNIDSDYATKRKEYLEKLTIKNDKGEEDYTEKEANSIIDAYFLSKKEVAPKKFVYISNNKKAVRNLDKEAKGVLQNYTNRYTNFTALNKGSQSAVPSDSGNIERGIGESSDGKTPLTKSSMRHRLTTIDENTQLLLAQYFDSDKTIPTKFVKKVLNGKDIPKNLVIPYRLNLDEFMKLIQQIDAYSGEKISSFIVDKKEDVYKSNESLRKKAMVHIAASDLYSEIEKIVGDIPRLKHEDNIITSEAVKNIYMNISKEASTGIVEKAPNTIFDNKYIVHALSDSESTNSFEDETIVLSNKHKNSIVYKISNIKISDTSQYRVNMKLKPGVYGTTKIDKDAIILEKLPNGIVIGTMMKGIQPGTKLINPNSLKDKLIVGNELSKDDKTLELYRKCFIDNAPTNLLNNGDYIGFSNKAYPLSKYKEAPEDTRIIRDADGNAIAMAIKTTLSVVENANDYNTKNVDSTIDYYTEITNSNSPTGLVFIGGYALRKENDDYVVDGSITKRIKNVGSYINSRRAGKTNGITAYKRMCIYTLCNLAEKIEPKDLERYKQLIMSKDIGGERGAAVMLDMIKKYFNGDLSKVKMTESQRALLSQELFEKATGYVYNDTDESKKSPRYLSKSKAPEEARTISTKSIGRDYTTTSGELEAQGRYGEHNYLSTLDLVNYLSQNSGYGIISDNEALTFHEDYGYDTYNTTADQATVSAFNSKFGAASLAKQDIYGDGAMVQPGEIDDTFGRSYKGTKLENLLREVTHNYNGSYKDLAMNSTKQWKAADLLNFFSHTENDCYDYANRIDLAAKSQVKYFMPSREFRADITKGAGITGVRPTERINLDEDGNFIFDLRTNKVSEFLNIRRQNYTDPVRARFRKEYKLDDNTAKSIADNENTIKEKDNNITDSILSKSNAKIGELINIKEQMETPADVLFGNTKPVLSKALDEDYKVDNAVSKNTLYPHGFEAKDTDAGVMATEAEAEYRYQNDGELDTPYYVKLYKTDENKTKFDYQASKASLCASLDRSETGRRGLNEYIIVRGLLDNLSEVRKNKETADIGILEQLKELGYDEVTAKEHIVKYEKANPMVVDRAMKIVYNAQVIINDINKGSHSGLNAYSLMSSRIDVNKRGSKESRKTKLRKALNNMFKSTTVQSFKSSYDEGDVYGNRAAIMSGGYVDFIDNMDSLVKELGKTQAIIRGSYKLPKNNVTITTILTQTVDELLETDENDNSKTELAIPNSKAVFRANMFDIISYRLGTRIKQTTDASNDYANAIHKIKEFKEQKLNEAGIKNDISYDDLKEICESSESSDASTKALLAYDSIYEIYHSLLCVSPKIKGAVMEQLKAVDQSSAHALVDTYGRKIYSKYDVNINKIMRKPIGNLNYEYITKAIGDSYDNENDYELALCVRALMGEVYIMDRLLADKLDENVFTTKIPSTVVSAIQKSSRWCSKMLMSQPQKLIRRLMQFSLYDFNMALTANPNTVRYISKSKKELGAFFQSKGAVCSDDLKDYLQHQGFKYSDIKGYDPVQMETTNDKSLVDRMYFDKVNNLFSQQNLLVRYAFYTAEKVSFDNNDPYYGVMYSKRNTIDKLEDNGLKAMSVIDATMGGPGGFSELSKKAGQYGFVFTTFPLAVARWASEGAATAKSFMTNIGETDKKQLWRSFASPIVTMGATYGIIYGLITALCSLYGVDEEDAEEMAKNQEFIDPIQTILNGGIVSVQDNSIFQLQAMIDAFDSFKTEETLSGKLLGFVNDNFLSHFNPLLKAGVESFSGKDLYGGKVLDNDNTVAENAERKFLGFMIGSAGANALLSETKAQEILGENSIQNKITAVLAAETGNTKAYKSEKKSYTKSLTYINQYLSRYYAKNESNYLSTEGFNSEAVSELSHDIKKALLENRGMDYVSALVVDATKKGYTRAEIKSSIKAVSVIGKLEKLTSMDLIDDFNEGLTDANRNAIQRAVEFEQSYFPYISDTLLEDESDDEKYYKSNSYHNDKNYSNRVYPVYARTNAMRNSIYARNSRNYNNKISFYKKGKSYYDNPIPPIKDLFINKMTDTTGKRAITIGDLIGDYYKNYYKDFKGELDGEYYKDRKNRKDGQSDWRN